MPIRTIIRSSLLVLCAVGAHAQEPALRGLDPVRLALGEEVMGREELTERSGTFLYRFADATTRATFLADVARHEIQLGGACARMGPLSGLGDKDRFAVHDGRIYVFASDQCRTGFLKQAERFFDPDAPRPTPDSAAAARGSTLLQHAIAAHGGADAIRALRTYGHTHTTQDGDYRVEHRLRVALPDRVRIDTDWIGAEKTYRYARITTADDAFFVDTGTVRSMHASARREIARALLHEPLFALRAALDGQAVACATGDGEIAGVRCEQFELWQNGTTTTFGIGADGRILAARFRGRGPQMWFGVVEQSFDYGDGKGLAAPRQVHTTFDGKPAPAADETRDGIELDGELPATLFRRPG